MDIDINACIEKLQGMSSDDILSNILPSLSHTIQNIANGKVRTTRFYVIRHPINCYDRFLGVQAIMISARVHVEHAVCDYEHYRAQKLRNVTGKLQAASNGIRGISSSQLNDVIDVVRSKFAMCCEDKSSQVHESQLGSAIKLYLYNYVCAGHFISWYLRFYFAFSLICSMLLEMR